MPAKVSISFGRAGEVLVEGPKGKLEWNLPSGVSGKVDGPTLSLSCIDDSKRALFGMSRALINNMVVGVSEGYIKELEIQGVGFKAAIKGKVLNLNLGYSHEINHPIPEGLKITVVDSTRIKVEGIDKQLVGLFASEVRSYYPPEPYKGKGVRYVGEQVTRKEGKTVQ